MKRRQAGYSLAELLVVVAIIGIVSLVSVPNFMAMMRSGRLKTSLRDFASILRTARERAVTRYRPVRVSFATGTAATARAYSMWEFDGTNWVKLQDRQLEETCYIASSTNITDLDSDGLLDIVYRSNGTPQLPTSSDGKIFLKTDWDISVPQYRVEVKPTGLVRSVPMDKANNDVNPGF